MKKYQHAPYHTSSHSAVQAMDDFTPKMHSEDTKRVETACQHVSDHVDFEQLARLLEAEDGESQP